jgi:hypothetical protein
MSDRSQRPPAGADREPDLPADGLAIAYIGGGTKSGSTLLDLMLGQLPGFVSVGELRQIWQRGCVENSRCGCRRPFHECPFWAEVGRVAFGGWGNLDVEEVLTLRNSLDRVASLRSLKGSRDQPDERLERYLATMHSLVRAIAQVAGARVIVDSSKTPSHALILERVPSVDLRLIHLVRDSRGVVFSWQRATRGKQRRRKLRKLRRRLGVSISASARWLSYNLRIPSVAKIGVPYHFVRYEDMVARPRETIREIVDHLSVPIREEDLAFVEDGRLLLQDNHTVYGNRLRFSTGELTLQVDDGWRREMAAPTRAWVTALTFPLLLRYGYPLGRGSAAASMAPEPTG